MEPGERAEKTIGAIKREVQAVDAPQEVRSIVARIGRTRVFEIEGKGHVIKHARGFATVGFDPSEFDGTDYLETIDKDPQ